MTAQNCSLICIDITVQLIQLYSTQPAQEWTPRSRRHRHRQKRPPHLLTICYDHRFLLPMVFLGPSSHSCSHSCQWLVVVHFSVFILCRRQAVLLAFSLLISFYAVILKKVLIHIYRKRQHTVTVHFGLLSRLSSEGIDSDKIENSILLTSIDKIFTKFSRPSHYHLAQHDAPH